MSMKVKLVHNMSNEHIVRHIYGSINSLSFDLKLSSYKKERDNTSFKHLHGYVHNSSSQTISDKKKQKYLNLICNLL